MRKTHLMSSGFAAQAADVIGGQVAGGLTATGTTQTDALLVSLDAAEFITVPTGAGARLPAAAEVGDIQEIYNYGANALLVYGPTGTGINAGALNAGFSIPAGGRAFFRRLSATRFGGFLSA